MDENSALILRRYFKEYYFRFGDRIKAPSQIESREFGYFPFGGAMIRHLAFKDIGSFRAILVKEAPAGAYCSNSLYADPSAEMHLKGWKRAELIFDIDADGLKNPCKKIHDVWFCKGCGKKEFGLRPETCPKCEGNRILTLSWTCYTCLEGTKKETLKLLEFLEFDFGISPSKMKVYFSGNAGYHISVEGSQYETLDSHGRAEIADYLGGRGIMTNFLESEKLSPKDPGWRGRIARTIRDLPESDPIFKSSEFEKRLGELLNSFPRKKVESFIQQAISGNSVKIDPMVTTDIHRIFRMPETLNNKTGLVKRECTENLDSFDPENDAIAIKDDSNMEVSTDIVPKIELGGSSYGPYRSEIVRLPLYVGVYIVSKGAGSFVFSSEKGEVLQKKTEQQVKNL